MKKKRNRISKSDFFRRYAEKLNYADPESLKPAYYALLRLILEELKDRKEIKLPDFGIFRLKRTKSREIIGALNLGKIRIPEMDLVKFKGSEMLKKYFNR